MQTALPTLSATGWVKNIGEKADMLFSHYLVSDYSQTYFYPGEVASLAKDIQINDNKPLKIKSSIEDTLFKYFNRYFESAQVEVAINNPDPEYPDNINIAINVTVFEGGYSYNLGKELQTVKGKLIQVFDIANG